MRLCPIFNCFNSMQWINNVGLFSEPFIPFTKGANNSECTCRRGNPVGSVGCASWWGVEAENVGLKACSYNRCRDRAADGWRLNSTLKVRDSEYTADHYSHSDTEWLQLSSSSYYCWSNGEMMQKIQLCIKWINYIWTYIQFEIVIIFYNFSFCAFLFK